MILSQQRLEVKGAYQLGPPVVGEGTGRTPEVHKLISEKEDLRDQSSPLYCEKVAIPFQILRPLRRQGG